MAREIDKIESKLRRTFHAICAQLGMSEDERRQMLMANYGVDTSTALDAHQLTDLVHSLEVHIDSSLDQWRKRLIAVIGKVLKAQNKDANIAYIKAVAVRASGAKAFNRIPLDRLRSLYNSFRHQLHDLEHAPRVTTYEFQYRPSGNELPN